MNAITYKEVFPLIKNNQMWLGNRFNQRVNGKNMTFGVPKSYPMEGTEVYIDSNGNKFISVAGTGWYTNIDHGRRHKPITLLTKEENLTYNKKLKNSKYQSVVYKKYDNYDAIEVPLTESIPSDYDGLMGVPISFLSKYCPEQFEILGLTQRNDDPYKIKKYTTDEYKNANDLNARATILINGNPKSMYPRILIRKI